MIHSHPVPHDVSGTMDGLKVRIEEAPDEIVQSRFYNGWKSDHFVTGVFGFVPNGTIAMAFYNVPGCSHDSTVADWGDIYDKSEAVYNNTGLKFVIDSAFSTVNHDFVIKSSQDDLTADLQHTRRPDCEYRDQERGDKYASVGRMGYASFGIIIPKTEGHFGL